ncbi:hypothetical protein CSB45_08635 [candidate division KSB3 bacterium]|uniref:RNA polymerase sigma-70 ECF-like HTH domain-containing protein n=1 Tax=candidate division KSB3 bacterium TaxID=2044937 RepID=A0A2G6E4H2_9BACT|nr:MAG: hypothetical protein CSB45_08635 [candidate division KSB3 bacterium]PIE29713.1 MAG: hypothetical protein CSA57_07800 [candidate division KSB3 bacterium]
MNYLRSFARDVERSLGTRERLACPSFLKSTVKYAQKLGCHPEDAREIVYESLSVLLIKAQKQELRSKSSLKALTRRITHHRCVAHLKRKFSRKRGCGADHFAFDESFHHVQYDLTHHCDPLQLLTKQETWTLVMQWIDSLKHEDYRAVFTLRMNGYERREISEKLCLPLKRIDTILHHGQKQLAALAKGY